MQIRLVVLGLATALVIQGCATVHPSGAEVVATVESHASPTSAVGKTYLLLPGNKNAAGEDAGFQKYAGYLRHMLSIRGFVPADKPSEADIAIVLSYGVVDTRAAQNEKPAPVWLQTRSGSGIATGAVTSGNAASSHPGDPAHAPSYGTVSQTSGSEREAMYLRYAEIDAYDAGSRQGKQIWMTKVVSMGPSGDLKRVFPFLMAAAAPYLASTTAMPRVVNVDESDPVVKAVEGKSDR